MAKPSSKAELMSADYFIGFLDHLEKDSEWFFQLHNNCDTQTSVLQQCVVDRLKTIEEDIHNILYSAWKPETANTISNEFYYYSSTIRYAIENVVNEAKFKYYFKLYKDEAIKLKFKATDTILRALISANSKGGRKNKNSIGLSAVIREMVKVDPKISELEVWRKLKKYTCLVETLGREFILKYNKIDERIIQIELINGEQKPGIQAEKSISQINIRDYLSKAKNPKPKKTQSLKIVSE